MDPIYLDHAATTPLHPEVMAAMEPFFGAQFHNPGALYVAARTTRQALETARHSIAQQLGARASEVIFTAGATEANNLALRGTLGHYGGELIFSAVEHPSISHVASDFDGQLLSVNGSGRVRAEELQALITDETTLVSVMYANNEVGTIQPIRELAKVVKTVRTDREQRGIERPLLLHTDAAQAANYLDLHVDRLGVDLLTLNAGKLYGPKQVGCLYVRSGVELVAQITGGGQERNLRSGTENVAGAVGFAKALKQSQSMRREESARLRQLVDEARQRLAEAIPALQFNGHSRERLPNFLHCSLPGIDGETAVMMLDELGVQVATGAACSAASTEPSPALLAMGLSEPAVRGSIRLTLGQGTSEASWRRAIDSTIDVLSRLGSQQ